MKKLVITLLLIVAAFFSFSQTSPTYENITIRNKVRLLGENIYMPALDSASTAWGLYWDKTTGKISYDSAGTGGSIFIRISGDTLFAGADTLVISGVNYWTQTGDDIENNNNGTTTIAGGFYLGDSIYALADNSNLPVLATGEPLGWVLGTEKGTGQFVRVLLNNLDEETESARSATASADYDYQNYIYYIRSGDYIYVRSNLGGTSDVVLKNDITAGFNTLFSLGADYLIASSAANTTAAYESGTYIHNSGDDIAPIYTNNIGYVSGNHGWLVPRVVSTGHDKDASDVGSRWTDGTYFFYIAEIEADTIVFLPEDYSYSTYWKTNYAVIGTLSHTSGATHTGNITVTSQSATQKSLAKNKTATYKVNGLQSIADGNSGYAKYIEVVESYEIADPSTVPVASPMDWTDGLTWFTVTNTYQFYGYGATSVYYKLEIERPINIFYFGALQSAMLNQGAYDDVLAYIPKVNPFTTATQSWDFQSIDTIQSITTQFYITDSKVSNTTNPPDRSIQFLKSDGAESDLAFAMGYNVFFEGSDSSYNAADTTHWYWYTSSKSYPQWVANTGTIDDTTFNTIAYRQYLQPDLYDSVTSVYFNKQGDKDVIYIDAHQAILNDTIPLPGYLQGKFIRKIEGEGMTITSGYTTTSNGIIVTVPSTYGYLVLELSGTYNPGSSYWTQSGNTVSYTGDAYVGGNLKIPTTTSTTGMIYQNDVPLINTYGTNNIFMGVGSGTFTTSGLGRHVGIGTAALDKITTGTYNTAIGYQAMNANTEGSQSVAIGHTTLWVQTTTGSNTAVGFNAGRYNRGTGNSFFGTESGDGNTTTASGGYNVGLGYGTLKSYTTGNFNIAIGSQAGNSLTSGSNNILIGRWAGYNLTTESGNVLLGYSAGKYVTGSNKLIIDNTDNTNYAGDTTAALIFGNFATNRLTINGDLKVTGLDSASTSYGVYYDKTTGLMTYDSAGSGTAGTSYWEADADTISNNNAGGIEIWANDSFATPTLRMSVKNDPANDEALIQFHDLQNSSTTTVTYPNVLVYESITGKVSYLPNDSISNGYTETDPVWISDSSTYISKSQAREDIHDSLVANSQGFLTALPASALEWGDTTATGAVGIATFDAVRDTAAAIRADFPAAGLANVVEDTSPQLGANLDLNEFNVSHDEAPTANLTTSGNVITLTAGAALAFGDVCYMGSDGKMEKGDADGVATAFCWTMALATISENATGLFALPGTIVRNDSWTWGTVGQPVYLDTATAGGMTQTMPTGTDDVIQIIGIATHADRIFFYPQLVQIELN